MVGRTFEKEFCFGLRAELPILLGVAPFGMIYGALAKASGLSAMMPYFGAGMAAL